MSFRGSLCFDFFKIIVSDYLQGTDRENVNLLAVC